MDFAAACGLQSPPDPKPYLARARRVGLDLETWRPQSHLLFLRGRGAAARRAVSGVELLGHARLDRADPAVGGFEARSGADALRCLETYDRGGPEALERLTGDFACLLSDPARRRLVAARDRIGARGLYWTRQGGQVLLASSLRLLLLLAGDLGGPDAEAIAAFLGGPPLDPDRTAHALARRLPPGARLIVRWEGGQGDLRLETASARTVAPPLARPDAAERFRELFRRAVRDRLALPQESAAFLSGGLDSSAIVMLAAEAYAPHAPLRTLSTVFDDRPRANERPQIELVARAAGADPLLTQGGAQGPFDGFDEILREQGGLVFAPGLQLTRRLLSAAAREGRRVVLDGHGGDEIVSHGTGRLADLAEAGRWSHLAREIFASGEGLGENLRSFALHALRFGPAYGLALRAVRARRRLARALGGAVGPASLARSAAAPAAAPPRPRPPGLPWETHLHHELIARDDQSRALEILAAAGEGAGVELRFPFWDEALVDFCLSLPGEEKRRGGYGRRVLREATPELPAQIRWRRDKLDFSGHLGRGLVDQNGDLLREVLERPAPELLAHVDPEVARAALAETLARGERASGSALQAAWRVVALAVWLDGLGPGRLRPFLERETGRT